MNYMAKVAEMLGVELEEEFHITGCGDGKFRLTKNDGLIGTAVYEGDYGRKPYTFREILLGKMEIQKIPWKPKEDEKYYIPDVNDRDLFERSLWHNDDLDKHRESKGLVFKTPEEAMEVAQLMLEYYQDWKSNKATAVKWQQEAKGDCL